MWGPTILPEGMIMLGGLLIIGLLIYLTWFWIVFGGPGGSSKPGGLN